MSTSEMILSVFCFFSMIASVLAFSAVVASNRLTKRERRERRSGDED